MAMDEDWKFRQLLEDLRSLHENALSAMREEIKQLRTDGEVSNDFTPSVELLPKALGPQLESSTPLQELVVDIDVPPMPELQDWIGDAPEVEVSVYPPKESDDEPIASRRASRKGTDEMAREAARAMLLVPMPPPSKSEEDANEAPTQRDSSKSIGKSRSSGASKKSTPKDAAAKSDEASRFAAAKEVIEAKSALDLSAELPSDAKLAKYLVSDRYELILGLVVLSSVAILAADFQFTGYVIGQEIGFKDMKSLPAGEEDPGWLQVLTLSMDIFFGLEVAFRVIVLRFVFFKIWVNWLDFVVVYLSLAVDIIGGMNAGFNVGVVRLLRLAKIARALRVVRMRRALESLSLLLRCVQSSLQVLFWSLGLLGVIQCIAGMVIGQLLVPYMRDMTLEAEGRHEVYKYFGTFSRTFLTMFEVLFANWAIPARICVENVGEGFIYIFIFYRCLVGYAVLNVVSAVFVQQTMKVAQQDQEYMMNLKQKQAEAYAQKLKRFFMTLDSSGDGLVSWDEFSVLLHDPQLQIWMSTLDLETHDLVQLFQMIDDGDGEISVEEFIDGATRLRGMARSLDVAQVLTSIKKVELKIEDIKSLVAAGRRSSTRRSNNKGSATASENGRPSSSPQFPLQLLASSPEVRSQFLAGDASNGDACAEAISAPVQSHDVASGGAT